MKKLLTALLVPVLLLPKAALAHCPLCTIGAGAAAVGASYLGVHNAVVGIFIGAFAMALGLWMARVIKRKFIPYQKTAITGLSFASVIVPVAPIMKTYSSIYISWAGEYGSLLNRTYLINLFLVGSLIGAVVLLISPLASKILTRLRRGKMFPFQGISITFLLLALIGTIIQVVV